MKIAITGGAGFIGSHLIQAYLDAGHDVLVIDSLVNGSHHAIDPRARFYALDIRDGKLQTILQRERPDIVSHHAAQREYTVPGEQSLIDADVHVRGLLNVLEACVYASVNKIIFASGGNTLYGKLDPEACPVKETTPLCPQRPYDISKVAGESYVRYYTHHYGFTHTILRYADVYGEAERERAQHPLNYFIAMLLEGRRPIIRGTGKDVRDHIFIDDVVRANFCALEHGRNATIHISSGQGYSLNQFYCAAAKLLSSHLSPVYVSERLAEPSTMMLDNTLAQRVLGWQPVVSFTEGVQRTVELLAGVGVRREVPRSTVQSFATLQEQEQVLPEGEKELVEDRAVAPVLV